ncbi:AAA family ATPase [Brevibacillus sp. SYSU BS000544]|uniref:AAA family ATPase n=1 Tax=Brevibacillus sp. SYSU BS000544 TaxID=3416443 RepID=UPI003CE579D3
MAEPYIIIVDGQQGSFKTSFMSVIAHQMGYFMGDRLSLFSNYELKDSKPFRSYTDFLEVAKCHTSLILLDEAQATLSSRGFSNKGQNSFTELMLFLRKLRTTMFLTSVRFEFIDSRIREICDIYIYATEENGFVTYDIFDFQRVRFIKRVQISVAEYKNILTQLNLFRTWRPVRSTSLPDEKTFQLFLEKLIIENDKYWEQVI